MAKKSYASPYKDKFTPENPEKYIGKFPIIYRSKWELMAMQRFDKHPNVLAWSSESISIPYQNPFTSKWSMYIPDFFVIYTDKSGRKTQMMIEIKPLEQTPGFQGKVSTRTGKVRKVSTVTQHIQEINAAKWRAAAIYCAKHKIRFEVITEKSLFKYNKT